MFLFDAILFFTQLLRGVYKIKPVLFCLMFGLKNKFLFNLGCYRSIFCLVFLFASFGCPSTLSNKETGQNFTY